MSEQNEKSGMGFGSIAAGAGIGGGAAAFVNNRISQGAVLKVIRGKEDASEKFAEALGKSADSTFDNAEKADASEAVKNLANELETKSLRIGNISVIPELEEIKHITFSTAEGGLHEAVITAEQGSHKISGLKKLPDGIKAGEVVEGDAVKKLLEGDGAYFKKALIEAEEDFAKLSRKAGGFGFGLKNMGMGGRAAVIGTALAGTAVGAYAVHAIFGGKHSDKVAAQPAMETAQGAAR